MDKSKINHQNQSYNIGKGQASVNLVTGRLLFEYPLLSIGSNNFQMSTVLSYSSQYLPSDFGDKKIGFGNGWKLNFHQYLIPYNASYNIDGFELGDYVYIDSSWCIHKFKLYTTGKYYDTSGTGLRLLVSGTSKIIKDENDNLYEFNNSGNLISYTSGINHNIKKVLTYNGDKLVSIHDVRKDERKIEFIYDTNGMLVETKNTLNNLGFNFIYKDNKLERIIKTSLNNLQYEFELDYYDDGRLQNTVNVGDLTGLRIIYGQGGFDEKVRVIESGLVNKQVLSEIVSSENYLIGDSSEDIVSFEKDNNNYFLTKEGKKHIGYSYDFKKVYDINEYEYNQGYTALINKFDKRIIYNFNIDGTLLNALHNENGNLFSMNELRGFKLSDNSGSGTTYFNNQISNILSKNSSGVVEYAVPFSEASSFKQSTEGYDTKYYNVSFWIKPDYAINVNENILARFSYNHRGAIKVFYSKVESTYPHVWQQVHIPVTVVGEVDELASLKVELVNISSVHTNLEFADLRIEFANYNDCFMDGENGYSLYYPIGNTDETKKVSIKIGSSYYPISSNFYLTENDIFKTFKSYSEKNINNGYFEFVYNNGKEVKYINDFKIYYNGDEVEYTHIINNKPNFKTISFINGNDGNSSITKEVQFIKEKDSNGNDTNKIATINYLTTNQRVVKVINNGCSLEVGTIEYQTTDSYSINGLHLNTLVIRKGESTDGESTINIESCTNYSYDTYGNIKKVEKLYENSLEKITKEYTYLETEERLKEHIKSVKENDVTYNYNYDDVLDIVTSVESSKNKQVYQYNDYLEHLKKITFINNSNNSICGFNNIKYNKNGDVSSFEGSDNINYKFRNNLYNESSKVYSNDNLIYETNLSEEYDETIIEEKVYQNSVNPDITRHRYDYYQKLLEVDNNGDKVTYEYENATSGRSPYFVRVKKITDPYTNYQYNYTYNDNYINPSVKEEVSDKYYIEKSNEKNIYKINTDDEKIVYEVSGSNRIEHTYYQKGIGTDTEPLTLHHEHSYTYDYDNLNRCISQKGGKTVFYSGTLNGKEYEDKVVLNKEIQYKDNTMIPKKYIYQTELSYLNLVDGSDTYSTNIEFENTGFDEIGNITGVKESGKRYEYIDQEYQNINEITLSERTTTYQYDSQNRLVSENNSELGNYEYEYDGVSGMLSKVIINGVTNKQFTHNNGRLTKVGDNVTINYDNYGNMLNTEKGTLAYNSRNKLSAYTFTENGNTYNNYFYYDHNGARYKKRAEVRKQTGGLIVKNVEYYLDGNRIIGEDWTDDNGALSTKIRYYYDAEGICGINYNGYDYNFIKDTLGNISKVVYQGRIIGEYNYDAWGKHSILYFETNKVDETTKSRERNVLNNNPFRYKGYYYDIETQLYWVSSRYYSPELCRWISPDSIEYLDPESINGLNLYAYCFNDPINYADPSGCFPVLAVILCGIALVGMGLTIGGVASDNNTLTAIGLGMVGAAALVSGGIALAGAIATGATLTGIIGGVTATAGLGSLGFMSAEIQEATGNGNWIMDTTGMSDGLYNTLLLSTAAIATLGTAASSVSSAFNIKSINGFGKYGDYYGMKFQTGAGKTRVLSFHNHGHKVAKGIKSIGEWHWQLQKWNPIGNKTSGTIAKWLWWSLTRI